MAVSFKGTVTLYKPNKLKSVKVIGSPSVYI